MGISLVVVGVGMVSSAMLGEKGVTGTEYNSDLLPADSRFGEGVFSDVQARNQDVPSDESAVVNSSLKIDAPGVADNDPPTGLGQTQFIGPFLDPDSEVLNNVQTAVQLIGDSETVDDGFEDTTAPLMMVEEDPDVVIQVSGASQQFIGEVLTVDQFDLLDVDVVQTIGEPESVPVEQ